MPNVEEVWVKVIHSGDTDVIISCILKEHRKKKVHEFPVSSLDVTNQTPPGQE